MYNLIVLPSTYQWKREHANLKKERFLEYTEASLIEQYSELDDKTVAYLKSIPSIFASEMGDAHLGIITNIIERRDEIRFYYEINDQYESIQLKDLTDKNFDFDTHKFELSRNHWALKDVDLFSSLKTTGLLKEKTPTEISESVDLTETSNHKAKKSDISTPKKTGIDWQTTAAKVTIAGVAISTIIGVLALLI